jgi:sugar phosphate isomerase/epimerase
MMIEIGTSTHAIAGFGKPSKPFRQALAEIAECGYQHFMLLAFEKGPSVGAEGNAPEALVNLHESDVQALLKAASQQGLRISCIYPGCALDFSDEGAQGTIERLLTYRERAWQLGCHVMAHGAGRAPAPRTPLGQKIAQIEQVARVMDAVSSDRPGQVFKMALDVHFGGIIETPADCRHLLKVAANRNSGLCLNMGHMTTLGEAGWTLLEEYPARVHVLAWKDHLTGSNLPSPVYSVELGKGQTPFAKYAKAYQSSACAALHLITFEDVPYAEKKDALARSRQYLLRLLAG